MPDKLKYILLLLACITAQAAFAQQYPNQPQRPAGFVGDTSALKGTNMHPLTSDQMIDTLRAREQRQRDSVIFSAKFIKVTNESLLKDSTQLFPIDTTLTNFEHYSLLFQPRSPKKSLSLGSRRKQGQASLLWRPRCITVNSRGAESFGRSIAAPL